MKTTEHETQDYMTAQELADMLKMSLKFVVTQTQARRIPGQVKIGRLWRYRRTEIQKRLMTGELLLKK